MGHLVSIGNYPAGVTLVEWQRLPLWVARLFAEVESINGLLATSKSGGLFNEENWGKVTVAGSGSSLDTQSLESLYSHGIWEQDLDSKLGNGVSVMPSGDMINVWDASGELILKGTLPEN